MGKVIGYIQKRFVSIHVGKSHQSLFRVKDVYGTWHFYMLEELYSASQSSKSQTGWDKDGSDLPGFSLSSFCLGFAYILLSIDTILLRLYHQNEFNI